MLKKDCDKIQHPFITTPRDSRLISKYNKVAAGLEPTLNGEKFKATLPNSGIRQYGPLSSYLFKIVLEVLSRAIRKIKEVKDIKL